MDLLHIVFVFGQRLKSEKVWPSKSLELSYPGYYLWEGKLEGKSLKQNTFSKK
jgi:hypothetical protein